MNGFPSELLPQLAEVDCITSVMAGAIAHPIKVILITTESPKKLLKHGQVVAPAIGPNQVRLPHAALGKDAPDGPRVVIDVNPIANIVSFAIKLRANAIDEVRNLARNELLHMLVGAVVIGAAGNGGFEAEGSYPGAHEHVGGCLGGAVGGAGAVRGLLGEAHRVVERQVAVDLVGGDVMVAHAVFPARLDEGVRATHVGLQEGGRIGDGVVVVGLRRIVDHGVRPRHQAVDQDLVADVTHDELHAVGGQARDVLRVAGVGELVKHGHLHPGVLARHMVDKVGPDKAAPASDDDAPRLANYPRDSIPSPNRIWFPCHHYMQRPASLTTIEFICI